ncbi:hypothetical protein R1flu_002814 [Riccia fluitans]|uniref:Uncharacterized protein n=1 Tax=Riccia fluitans TaxID=41844 RepID=A0ABD1YAZ4_9MARC
MRETIRNEDAKTRERQRKEFDDMVNYARAEAAVRQQAERDKQEGVLHFMVEKSSGTDIVEERANDALLSNDNMDDDQDLPALEKIPMDLRKRDGNELNPEECQSPRRHWRGVEFIGSNIEIQGTSPMDVHIDLQAAAKYIDQNQESECSEASSLGLDSTVSETYDNTRPNSYHGIVPLMGDSEGLLELLAINKVHVEETMASKNADILLESTFDWEAYKAPVDQDEINKITVQEAK